MAIGINDRLTKRQTRLRAGHAAELGAAAAKRRRWLKVE